LIPLKAAKEINLHISWVYDLHLFSKKIENYVSPERIHYLEEERGKRISQL